ncbi:sterol-binding-like protein [Coemansia reversa NRRL 1564]|uniref:Sterol-binding-like protein n=1 Tax=Coemansia reversa (strain ATCC 12441 / NRRL 1564) TaxID=763665 RepID=A0A2G5BAW3_COERN|nr:sterol-binding-like protein [Coemansia reversa NRRL 1564]|eukprot:PIA16154.1 sterol-binding-like protein [Coemansia reversa NRRL 1564]
MPIEGFASSSIIDQLTGVLTALSPEDRKKEVNKTKAVYAFEVTNSKGGKHYFVVDLKQAGKVTDGKTAGVVLILKDGDFVDLASGKLTGQGAFMGGKLKSKGNIMLALKLESVLKAVKGAVAKL